MPKPLPNRLTAYPLLKGDSIVATRPGATLFRVSSCNKELLKTYSSSLWCIQHFVLQWVYCEYIHLNSLRNLWLKGTKYQNIKIYRRACKIPNLPSQLVFRFHPFVLGCCCWLTDVPLSKGIRVRNHFRSVALPGLTVCRKTKLLIVPLSCTSWITKWWWPYNEGNIP